MDKKLRLKSMRNYRGMSITDAAKQLGISKQALHKKEMNEEGIKFKDFVLIAESYKFKIIGFPEEEITLDYINP